MNIDTAIIANAQAAELMEQRQRLLHHIPVNAQPVAVFLIASSDRGLDSSLGQDRAVRSLS